VRREAETRRLELEPTRGDALVERAQWTVRIERQHDDVGLHEPHRRPERHGDRRRRGHHGLESPANLADRDILRDRPHAGGSRERDVRDGSGRELGIGPSLHRTHLVQHRPGELRHHEDPTFHRLTDVGRSGCADGQPRIDTTERPPHRAADVTRITLVAPNGVRGPCMAYAMRWAV
jgi:hypothetical protein